MSSDPSVVPTEDKKKDNRKEKLISSIFFLGVTGASVLGGFGMTLARTRKSDPTSFDHGVAGASADQAKLAEAGGQLAMRALGRATMYAVGGFTVFCFGVWKLSGAKDLQDFRLKAGAILPRIPKNDPPQSRTEFSGINDLLQYLIDEDERKKKNS